MSPFFRIFGLPLPVCFRLFLLSSTSLPPPKGRRLLWTTPEQNSNVFQDHLSNCDQSGLVSFLLGLFIEIVVLLKQAFLLKIVAHNNAATFNHIQIVSEDFSTRTHPNVVIIQIEQKSPWGRMADTILYFFFKNYVKNYVRTEWLAFY